MGFLRTFLTCSKERVARDGIEPPVPAFSGVTGCRQCLAIALFSWGMIGRLWMWPDSDVVGEAGIEPATPDLEGPCSIQLSYSPALRPATRSMRGLAEMANAQRVSVRCIDCSGAAGRFKVFAAQQGNDVFQCQLPAAVGKRLVLA